MDQAYRRHHRRSGPRGRVSGVTDSEPVVIPGCASDAVAIKGGYAHPDAVAAGAQPVVIPGCADSDAVAVLRVWPGQKIARRA